MKPFAVRALEISWIPIEFGPRVEKAADVRNFRNLSGWIDSYLSTCYRGVRCSIGIAARDNAQLTHANITHPIAYSLHQ